MIAPRASFTVDGYAYLEAWCDLAQGIRTFRLDRIASATLVPAPKATGSVTQTPHEDGPSLVPPEAPSARIAVDPDAAWIWDSDPVTADGGSWQEHPDGQRWLTGTVPYASVGWLLRYLLGRGGQVALLEPLELRREVADEARRKAVGLRAAEGSSG